MICPRCGIVNRADRVACVHCFGPVIGLPDSDQARCADHADVPATGQCVQCKKLLCDDCGGLYNNDSVLCLEHTEAAMLGALSGNGKQKKAKQKKEKPPKKEKAPKKGKEKAAAGAGGKGKKGGLFGKKK